MGVRRARKCFRIDSFVILIDKATNSDDDELLETVKHETCHVATRGQEGDPNGAEFQNCMTILKAWKPHNNGFRSGGQRRRVARLLSIDAPRPGPKLTSGPAFL